MNSGYTVRDSAGVTIVESLEPAWGEGEGWTLSAEPILDIGVVEGEAIYQLHEVRDATRAPNGEVLVADGGTQEVRIYDSTGRFLRSIGGAGEGPGEFGYLWSIEAWDVETLLAFDFLRYRITSFDGSGRVLRSANLGGEARTTPWGLPAWSGRESFVWAWTLAGQPLSEGGTDAGRIERGRAVLVRYSSDGVPMDTIGVFPNFEVGYPDAPAGGAGFGRPLMFGRELTYAARADRTWVGTGDGYEILLFGLDGVISRILRRVGLDLRVSQAAVDSVLDAVARGDADLREGLRQSVSEVPLPEQRAPYGDFLADSQGYLWVSEYYPQQYRDPPPPVDWDIFDPEGRWLGEMHVPEGFKVFEVGEEYVLGVARDALDVEHLRMYGLAR